MARIKKSSVKSVGKAALQMAFGTMTSRILGLARELCFAALFPRTVTDAFNVAFRLPNLFRRILGEGSLSVAFVPVFIEELQKDKESSKRLVNSTFTLLCLLTLTLTALGIIFMEDVISILTSGAGYQSVPGKVDLTVVLARIMFIYLFLVTTYAFYMAVLNSLGEFTIPAMGPTLFNIFLIASTLLPDRGGVPGSFLAWGVVLGGVAQAILLLPSLKRHGFVPSLTLNLGHSSLRTFFKSLGPGLLGMGILQLNVIINTQFASRLEEGTQSWIVWSDRILELPLSLIAVSLGSALLPRLSELYSANEHKQMNEVAHTYWRVVLFLSLPCAAGFFFLSEPIIEVLFKRGLFGERDLKQTSLILMCYAPLLISSAFTRVLAPSFYAIKNTWTPAVTGAVSLVLHYFLAQQLMELYGVAGLSSSLSVSAMFNLILLLCTYHFMIGPIQWLSLMFFLLKLTVSCLPLFFLSHTFSFIQSILSEFASISFIVKLVSLSLTIALASVSFFCLAFVLNLKEAQVLVDRFRRLRFRRQMEKT